MSASPDVAVERACLTRQDWEQAALGLIAEKGVGGLAVEPLARRLGITKGSFYWHFPGRDELLAAALLRWERQDEENLEISFQAKDKPADRLENFIWRTTQQTLTHQIHLALCADQQNALVSEVLGRVTNRRIAFLAKALEELGLDGAAANKRATLLYSAYVGYLHLQSHCLMPPTGDARLNEYVDHVIDSLIKSR
ncbi:MAG: TetR/AcrR family transcriptional regulator [Wenzhouxiangella sp.]|jgi:AcrR family transcriptional regulator|nr:TetR/AcrR family transcriptional regulator [Wenzhouxiangella sp.]MDR9452484.1 TetR/AcrR family transcriptional regulator [Wenzhouxiangella sp.]